jgi:L-fuconolactonase
MRVDAHQHFWHYEPSEFGWIDGSMAALRRDFGPADVQPEMARAGFEAGIAVQARQSLAETEFLLDLSDRHPSVRGVVGWVDLQSPHVGRQLARLAVHPRFVGVRHIVQGEPDERFLLRPDFLRGVAQLAPLGLSYDILIYPRQLPAAVEFVERLPEQRFVLDHLAKPDILRGEIRAWSRELRRLAEFPKVCAKLSGLVTEADWRGWTPDDVSPYLDVAFECFGASRLMIGSDWPVCTVAGDYSRVMGLVMEYLERRPAAERDAVLGDTAVRFWNLDRRTRAQEEQR